jgi:LPXTG-motif cell wall-anchored protein
VHRFLRLTATVGFALFLVIAMNARSGGLVMAGSDPCATVSPTDEPATTIPGTDVPPTDVPATVEPTATDTAVPTDTIAPTATDIPATATDIPPSATFALPTATLDIVANGGLYAGVSQQPGSLRGLQQETCATATSPAVVDPTSQPAPTEAPVVLLPNTGTGSSNTGSITLLLVVLVAVAGIVMRMRHSFRR